MKFFTATRSWGDILPRYSFLEPLLADRRVLEIGCGDGTGALVLSSRGPEQVVGVEREGAALEAALARPVRAGLSFRAFDGQRLDFASASFDLVIAFDLADRLDARFLSEIERVLKPNGYLVTALVNQGFSSLAGLVSPAGSSAPVAYERFVAWLQERFARVSVFAQSPFVGFSIGWLGADAQDTPLEMDTGLLPDGGEDVAFYLAVCGRESIPFESQSLVQLPYGDVIREVLAGVAQHHHPDGGAQDHLAQLRGLVAERDEEIETLRARTQEQEQLAHQVEQRRAELADRLTILEGRLADGDNQVEVLRQELVRRDRSIERLRADLNQHDQDVVGLERGLLADLLGLSSNEPLVREDLARLVRAALEQRAAEVERLARLSQANDQLKRSADGSRERFEALAAQLLVSRQSASGTREQIASLAAEVAEKASWLNASRDEVTRLEEKLVGGDEKIAGLQKTIAQLERERRDRIRSRSDQEVLVASLREENQGLKRALERFGQDVESSRELRQRLEAEVRATQAAAEQRLAQREELGRQLEHLRQELKDRDREGMDRIDLITQLEERLTQVERERRELQADAQQANLRIGALEGLLATTEERFGAAAGERELLQTELADRETELRQLRHQLTEETGLRASVEERLSAQVQRNRELESDLVSLVNRIEDGQERDFDRRRSLEEFQVRLAHQHQELEDAREKVDQLTRELFSARRQEEDLTAAIDLMRSAVVEQEHAREELEGQLSNLKVGETEDLRSLKEQFRRTQTDLANDRRQLEQRTAGLQRSEGALERLRTEATHLRREMERVQDRLAESQDRLAVAEATRARAIELERELAWYREELERVSAELHSRQEEFEEAGWELQRHQDEASQLREELQQTQVMAGQAAGERDENRVRSDAMARECSGLKDETVALRAQCAELQASSRENSSRLDAFQGQVDQRESDLEEARRRLDQEQSHSRALGEELDRVRLDLKNRGEPNREELELAAEREQTLQARLATLQKQLADLEGQTGLELSSLGEQIRRREEQMQKLTERLAELDGKRAWWEERAAALQAELEQRQHAAASLQQQVAERDNHIRLLEAELARQQNRLAAMQGRSQEPGPGS